MATEHEVWVPKSVATAPSSLAKASLGSWIRVFMSTDAAPLEGSLFTLDPTSGFLVLEAQDATQLVHMDAVVRIEAMDTPPSAAPALCVTEDDLRKLELRTRQQAEKAIASIGKNVSPTGQAIFDALSKTMPCEWEDQNIRVMHEVVILPPYASASCQSTNKAMLDRIRKVLDGEHRKLRLKQ
ncbi:hypothetical protein SPRG_05543 [Saprolegnia parasitica CBS 223.65]|uniref:AD domain-containing protein n=1 Tax=Saprolegnia parasitica (strain CBS 223.65) TaxID=695850 RepID=A0A067CK67_SAPPC|nr:hypothetical protein SPRG_05543 [Saprolegnia parasitica CBS 223.65]KDO29590.1 hypothetical protein SPRG_05543 [Saprolegnia parasitica CBS 223.65]|eukprot:XP_012199651.1 hypothetical protein SPRG_05543 [Saprolegnia parasitica CBS 223.65]